MKPIIFVDIDDTLIRQFGSKRLPMTMMVAKIQELSACAQLYAWSSGGADYARKTCAELGLTACFQDFLPKPTLAIDDHLQLPVLHPNEILNLTPAEILAQRHSSPT